MSAGPSYAQYFYTIFLRHLLLAARSCGGVFWGGGGLAYVMYVMYVRKVACVIHMQSPQKKRLCKFIKKLGILL